MYNALNTIPSINIETVNISTWMMTFDRTDQEMWILINGTRMIPVDQSDIQHINHALRTHTPMWLIAYQGKRGFLRKIVRTTNQDATAVRLVFTSEKDRRGFASAFYASEGMSHFG